MADVQHYAFDTLGYAKALRDRGYEQGQAEALAETTRDYIMNEVATKDVVHNEVVSAKDEMKAEIKEVKAELQDQIKEVKVELQDQIREVKVELQDQIKEVKAEVKEVKNEVKEVRKELQSEIEKVHLAIKLSNQSLKIWVGGIAVLMTGTLATIMKLLG